MQQKLDTCRANHPARIWYLINWVIPDLYSDLNCVWIDWRTDSLYYRTDSQFDKCCIGEYFHFVYLSWLWERIASMKTAEYTSIYYQNPLTFSVFIPYYRTFLRFETLLFQIFSLGPPDPIRLTFITFLNVYSDI